MQKKIPCFMLMNLSFFFLYFFIITKNVFDFYYNNNKKIKKNKKKHDKISASESRTFQLVYEKNYFLYFTPFFILQ